MNQHFIPFLTIVIATAQGACAEQRIELNNIYPLTQQSYQLGDQIYYTQDNEGYFEVIEGPLEDGPARCLGAGFAGQDGTSSINGICIFGEGDDTFTMRWDAGQQGAANLWVIVAGSGKFEGMTGKGIATTGVHVMYKALPLRQTHIVGNVDIPAQ